MILFVSKGIKNIQTSGVKELTSSHFVEDFNQNKVENLFYFIAFTSYPSKESDQLIYAMNVSSIIIKEDLDIKASFINLNISNDPKILSLFKFNISTYPKAYMMYSKTNYSLIEYNDAYSPNRIAETIKSFVPSIMIEIQNLNELQIRINKSNNFMIFGIFTDTKSPLFIEFNQTSFQEFRFARSYYSINFMKFNKIIQKSGYENDIFIIRNPYLYGDQHFISYRTSGFNNLSDFLKSKISGDVELCTPNMFKVYALQKIPVYVFVYAPKYKREGLDEIIQNLHKLNYDDKKIKICVSISGFDDDLLRSTHSYSVGESFIVTINRTIYKSDKYKIYQNYTINLNNLKNFLDDFFENKLPEYINEKAEKNLKLNKKIQFIDNSSTFEKFISNHSLNLLIYLYEGKGFQSVINNINDLCEQLKNYSKIVKVGVINTEVALIDHQDLKYGKNDIFIFRRANTSNFMAYKGQRTSQGLLEFIKFDINEQNTARAQSNQKNIILPATNEL